MTFDCSLINDQHVNIMNGIFQDWSQMRHALFERLGYIGQTNGQFILLGGLGRITGAWSYDITCRDITAINGAGTVSTYLNAVNDSTATYSGVTIENIYNYVSNISNIVDDRVAAVASQGGESQTAPARISDIRISHIYIEMDPAQNTTGLVNGVKLDTGTWGYIQNVSVRDVFFKGDGSTAAQAPFIVLLGSNGYIQDYLVDGVYGYKCGAVRCRLSRLDYAPSVIVRNVVLEQSHENNGLVQLYTSSGGAGDELVTFDSINVHTTANSGSAIMLEGGTSGQGATGSVNIRGLIAKGTSIGVSTNKTDTGATLQSGYSNINISDSNLSAVTTPFSGTGTYTVRNVVGMTDTTNTTILSPLSTGDETIPRLLVRSNTITLTSGTIFLSYFTAQRTETINNVTTTVGGTVASGGTFAGYAIYSVASSGALTLVASTASNTSLWTSAFQSTTGSNVKQALTSSFSKVAGQRYAVGMLFVGTTAPTVSGTTPMAGDGGSNAVAPTLCSSVTGQSSFPASIATASLTNTGFMVYAQLLP